MKLNQTLILATLALAAFTSGAWAQTQTASNTAPVTGPPAAAATAALPAPPPVTIADIQALKDALAAQQQQIAALQAQLQSKNGATQQVSAAVLPATTPAISPAPAPVPASPATVASNFQEPQTEKTNQNAGSSDERIRNLERQIQGLGPISFSGDVRLRAEPFF